MLRPIPAPAVPALSRGATRPKTSTASPPVPEAVVRNAIKSDFSCCARGPLELTDILSRSPRGRDRHVRNVRGTHTLPLVSAKNNLHIYCFLLPHYRSGTQQTARA